MIALRSAPFTCHFMPVAGNKPHRWVADGPHNDRYVSASADVVHGATAAVSSTSSIHAFLFLIRAGSRPAIRPGVQPRGTNSLIRYGWRSAVKCVTLVNPEPARHRDSHP